MTAKNSNVSKSSNPSRSSSHSKATLSAQVSSLRVTLQDALLDLFEAELRCVRFTTSCGQRHQLVGIHELPGPRQRRGPVDDGGLSPTARRGPRCSLSTLSEIYDHRPEKLRGALTEKREVAECIAERTMPPRQQLPKLPQPRSAAQELSAIQVDQHQAREPDALSCRGYEPSGGGDQARARCVSWPQSFADNASSESEGSTAHQAGQPPNMQPGISWPSVPGDGSPSARSESETSSSSRVGSPSSEGVGPGGRECRPTPPMARAFTAFSPLGPSNQGSPGRPSLYTTTAAKEATLVDAMMRWLNKMQLPNNSRPCCPFHASVLELRRCSKSLARRRCCPSFGPSADAQCRSCGVLSQAGPDWDLAARQVCDVCGSDLVMSLRANL